MASPIVGANGAQETTSIQPTQKITNIAKPPAKNGSSAPEDRVTISSQAHTAHHAIQAQQNGSGK